MYFNKMVVSVLIFIGLFGASFQQIATTPESQMCQGYYTSFASGCKVDLSSLSCTSDQVAACFKGNTTQYKNYICCNYDVISKSPSVANSRKLAQGSGCAYLFNQYAIQYETENLAAVVPYCKQLGYKTNYTLLFGDVAALKPVIQPEAVNDKKAPQPPRSSSSSMGVSLVAFIILSALFMLV